MEARVETLMENLVLALMQANSLAADSSEYEALAETVGYALDLADLGLQLSLMRCLIRRSYLKVTY